MLVIDMDDFGCNRILSDQCQSHDCRDKLDEFHYANNNFKATLFAIPSQMTYELLEWCRANSQWIELAVHGIGHTSNYECDKMTYEEFDTAIAPFLGMIEDYFVTGFKAPGWQVSDDIYRWLIDHDWWVADQAYNNTRRPPGLFSYINDNGNFYTNIGDGDIPQFKGLHYHTWDCVGNGVYELSDQIKQDISNETEFKFISEVLA
jgi:hypothetical protein